MYLPSYLKIKQIRFRLFDDSCECYLLVLKYFNFQ